MAQVATARWVPSLAWELLRAVCVAGEKKKRKEKAIISKSISHALFFRKLLENIAYPQKGVTKVLGKSEI